MSRPSLAFAMDPQRTAHVITPASLARLEAVADVMDPMPLTALHGARADVLLSRAEILVTGWGCPKIDAAVLDSAPNLRLIAHAAGTVKYFLGPEVFARGIAVTHAAEANARPVAEFTLAAMLFAGKRVFGFRDAYAAARGRPDDDPWLAAPIGNYRRTIGIIGASRIGRQVMALLAPFDYEVLLYDPFVTAEDALALGATKTELDALLSRADIVSLHAPVLPTTVGMIGRRELALLRDGTTFINTARGVLVDQDALIAELASGRIDAVIDVTAPEIPEPGSPLYTLPNVFLTPHIAGAVGLERMRLGELIVEEVERFVAGRPLLYGLDLDLMERQA